MDADASPWPAQMNGGHGRHRAPRGDCPTKDIVPQRAAGVRGRGAAVNGCAHSRLPPQARRAYDANRQPLPATPPPDVVIDLLASAGAVLLVSLSLVTRRGLCLCSA